MESVAAIETDPLAPRADERIAPVTRFPPGFPLINLSSPPR